MSNRVSHVTMLTVNWIWFGCANGDDEMENDLFFSGRCWMHQPFKRHLDSRKILRYIKTPQKKSCHYWTMESNWRQKWIYYCQNYCACQAIYETNYCAFQAIYEQSYSPSDCTGKDHLFLQEKQNTEASPFHVHQKKTLMTYQRALELCEQWLFV